MVAEEKKKKKPRNILRVLEIVEITQMLLRKLVISTFGLS